jgi:hypothetical protein
MPMSGRLMEFLWYTFGSVLWLVTVLLSNLQPA